MNRTGLHPIPVAQYLRLREQIPSLYGLLAVNAAVLAYTHRALAPLWLVVIVPAILILACLARMTAWQRPLSQKDLVEDHAVRRLRRSIVMSVVLALGFVSWALALDDFGGLAQNEHVSIFVAVTVLGCLFCLSYLPKAALAVSVTVLSIYLIHAIRIGTEVAMAIAFNISVVAAVIVKKLRDSYRSFVELENSERELRRERRQAQTLGEENARLALTDALTGVPNRRFFFSTLEQLLERAEPGEIFSVGLIDLDRFKPVNDTYGHAQGDRLLKIIGQRMISQCRAGTIIARLGGDEFGLIVMDGPERAEEVALSMCKAISEPAQLGDVTVAVGCSAGLAVYPETATTAHLLYDRADFALYHAKKHKRGQCERFSEELEHLIRSEQALDSALQGADLRRELTLAFQPIVATDDLEPVAVECLARWTSPRLGNVSPELLIPSAERIGRSHDVTVVLFEMALDALAQLPESLRLSFNLSGADLCNAGTIDALLERISASRADAHRLVVEITESSLITELKKASAALERLRKVGVQIALDDFGTGYSSLSSLHQLPLDTLKVDRSFAARLDEAAGRRLITAIRHLARSLSLECVIEGIETESQLVSARLAGFSLAQGYFIARPMSLDAIQDRLRRPGLTMWSRVG